MQHRLKYDQPTATRQIGKEHESASIDYVEQVSVLLIDRSVVGVFFQVFMAIEWQRNFFSRIVSRMGKVYDLIIMIK